MEGQVGGVARPLSIRPDNFNSVGEALEEDEAGRDCQFKTEAT